MSDKRALLDQLKIDRSQPETGGVSWAAALTLSAVAAVAGAGVMYYLSAGSTEAAPTPPPEAPPAAAVREAPVPAPQPEPARQDARILNASGYITARRIATVSSQITGLITQVDVEEGMRVEAGQELARLDDAVARVNLQLAESQLDALKAQVENIEVNLDEARRVATRARSLRRQNLTSEADVTRSDAAVAALEADLRNARANIAVSRHEIQRQQETLDDHVIRAPFGGVVTVKNAQTGEIVSPVSAGGGFTRTGICTIVDMDSLEIEVDVNEAFIGRVTEGQPVEARLDAYPDWTIPASVIAIIPTADRAKATVKVRIRIEEKDSRILPDMGVKVAFLRT